jgi:hypothetical protein
MRLRAVDAVEQLQPARGGGDELLDHLGAVRGMAVHDQIDRSVGVGEQRRRYEAGDGTIRSSGRILVMNIAVVLAFLASATQALADTHTINKVLHQDNTWMLTLTAIDISESEMRINVLYENRSSSARYSLLPAIEPELHYGRWH